MENITLETLSAMDNSALALLVQMKEAFDKAKEAHEFIVEKVKFGVRQYKREYTITPKPDPKNPMLVVRPNCGEIRHDGTWTYTDNNNFYPFVSPLSNVSHVASVFSLKVTVEGIFALYRAKVMVDMGLEPPKEAGSAEYVRAAYQHFQDFLTVAGNYDLC